MNYTQRIEALLDDMSVFEDWTEKYEFIISLGRKLPAMPDKYRKPANLIKGCQSRVWVGTEVQDGKMIISDVGAAKVKEILTNWRAHTIGGK